MRWADARGDSFGLSRLAADRHDAEFVVFCGVHFMAESADILTRPHQQVLLPDLAAGCSMADMADIDQVEEAWDAIATVTDVDRVVPITYMNSTAALKAFVGRHGGAVCTSSNARRVLEWALREQADRPAAEKVLFFPDQHLGRNTALEMGFDASTMVVWDPRRDLGGLDDVDVKDATFLLWKGHCSVHQRFRTEHVAAFRSAHPDGLVVVHPECSPRGRGGRGPRRLDGLHHPHRGRRTGGHGHRRRHRDPPREAAGRRASCAARRVPRPVRVPVHDDVAYRRAAPRAGSSRSSSPAGCATGSPWTRDRRATHGSRSSGCSRSPGAAMRRSKRRTGSCRAR